MRLSYFTALGFSFLSAATVFAGGDTTQTSKKLQITLVGVSTESAQVALIGNVTTEDFRGAQVATVFNTASKSVDGVQASACFNYAGDSLKGAQLSGFMNAVNGNVNGVQMAGSLNVSNGDVNGMQASGGANIISGNVKRCQFAGGLNISRDVSGIQASGGANLARNVKGFQASGGLNFAENLDGVQATGGLNVVSGIQDGLQISGGLNFARNVKGVQLGVVNIADSSSGVSIGVFSFVRTGYHKIQIGYNEALPANISFRTGSSKFYNIFSFGFDLRPQTPIWSFGYGGGTEITLRKNLAVNIDLTGNHINQGRYSIGWSDLYKLHATVDFKPMKKISIAAGPTLNVFVSDLNPGFGDEPVRGLAPWYFFTRTYSNDINVKSWIGFDVALRFL